MRVLFVSAEVAPFAKVGGLADVVAGLPSRLRETGHDVRVVTPCHASSIQAFEAAATRRRLTVRDLEASRDVEVATVEGEGGVPVDLVLDRHYFGRQTVYGDGDDLLRYQFFCRAVAALVTTEGWTPDILHLNDWHTAPLAFALRNLAWSNARLRSVASIFTIHNLRYRGPDDFNDFLAQAIYYSDVITTVSPSYAREILTPELGEGLDHLLGLRHDRLRGILNGLVCRDHDPATDTAITSRFDVSSIERRQANKAALRAELELPDQPGPILGMVTRLTEQKGIDLVVQALSELVAEGAQIVVLGQGDPALVADLRSQQEARPGAVRLVDRFDDLLARRIHAGADMFLMPSRFEPCGLGQLIAMRYGCIPIGRRTGGLADTILDPADHPDAATGFLFDDFTPMALSGAFERALHAFHDAPAWHKLQVSGMSRDFSWRASASSYVEAYVAALRSRGVISHP